MPTDEELFPYIEKRRLGGVENEPVIEVIPGVMYMHKATMSRHFNIAVAGGTKKTPFRSVQSNPRKALEDIITAAQYMLATYYSDEAPEPAPIPIHTHRSRYARTECEAGHCDGDTGPFRVLIVKRKSDGLWGLVDIDKPGKVYGFTRGFTPYDAMQHAAQTLEKQPGYFKVTHDLADDRWEYV